MAISEEKKRVAFSLSEADIFKLKLLHEQDKENSDKRIYESDTLKKLIDVAYSQKIAREKNGGTTK